MSVFYISDEDLSQHDFEVKYPYITIDSDIYLIKAATPNGLKIIKLKEV